MSICFTPFKFKSYAILTYQNLPYSPPVNDFFKKCFFVQFICIVKFKIMAKKSSAASTAQQQTRMLKALQASYCNVTRATKAVGITRQTHYNWYKNDQEYQDKVDDLKFECHEEFKDLVMEGIVKKLKEGNTAILSLCYKTLVVKDQEHLSSMNPYKTQMRAVYKLSDHKSVMYAKDPDTSRILSEIEEEGSNPRQRLDPFSPEGIRAYEEVLRRQREGK